MNLKIFEGYKFDKKNWHSKNSLPILQIIISFLFIYSFNSKYFQESEISASEISVKGKASTVLL